MVPRVLRAAARLPIRHKSGCTAQRGIMTEHIVPHFHNTPGVPVIEIWQTFWAGDLAVEVAKITHRADRTEFHFRTIIE